MESAKSAPQENNNDNTAKSASSASLTCISVGNKEGICEKSRAESTYSLRTGNSITPHGKRGPTMLIPNSFGIPTLHPPFDRDSRQHSQRSLRKLCVGKKPDRNRNRSRQPSRMNSKMSQTTQFDLDEIEYLLQEKAKHNFRELRHNFVINDPEGMGNLSRDAFARVLTQLLYWPIKSKHVAALLPRLGFDRRKKVINFTEFYTALLAEQTMMRRNQSKSPLSLTNTPPTQTQSIELATDGRNEDANQLDAKNDTQKSTWSFVTQEANVREPKPMLQAPQAMAMLRQGVHKGSFDPTELMSCAEPFQVPMLPRVAFARQLARMGLQLSESEFVKLWNRFQPDDIGLVSSNTVLRHLCLGPNGQFITPCPAKVSRKKEAHLPEPNQLEAWLLHRFRKGFKRVHKILEAEQTQQQSSSSPETTTSQTEKLEDTGFAKALVRLHLPELKPRQIVCFLKRYGLAPTKQGALPYRELLRRFQDRSEAGVAHQILTDSIIPKKPTKTNEIEQNDDTDGPLLKLEHELITRFHREFLQLLKAFREADPEREGLISLPSFCHILKQHFGIKYDREARAQLNERLPLNQTDHVRYGEFMRQFDTIPTCLNTLFDRDCDDSKNKKETQLAICDTQEAEVDQYEAINRIKNRPRMQLLTSIRDYVRRNLNEVTQQFQEIDPYNSGRMTQDQFYQLLLSLKLEPEITRGEIRILWPSFFIDRKQTLNFSEFLRYFLYNRADAAFPNSKLVPPKIGDADLMPLSKRLNGATCMLKDSLRSKIELYYEQLLKEFLSMDPEHLGSVRVDQFVEVMTELCLPLTDLEREELMEKFACQRTGRISYTAILAPFARKRCEKHEPIEKPRKRTKELARVPKSKSNIPRFLYDLRTKKQLSQLSWNRMRRTMQRADLESTGRLEAPIFRDLFQQGTGIRLTDEQVYHLLATLDKELSGTLPYVRLLHEAQTASQVSIDTPTVDTSQRKDKASDPSSA